MKSKRFLAVLCLILCVVMVFSFAACGQDKEKPNDGDKVAEKVTVTFKNGDTVVDTIEIVKGTAATATTKTVTAPEGKQFKSWQKDGADWDFTAKVNENITLTATFEDIPEPPVEKVTVTFKNGETVVDTVEIVKGTAATATTKTVTAPEGKQFKSWQKDGADWDFTAKVNEDITLIATFEDIPEPPVEKVTVTFKNGETVVDTIEIVKGTAVTATTKTVTAPEGKQFKSWQKDGADWDFTATVNEDITLIATFEDIPQQKFTITFKDADGNVVDTIQVAKDDYIPEDKVPTAPDLSAQHKTFVRWGLSDMPEIGIDCEMEIIEDLTYVAVYETVKYTVTVKNAADDSVLDTLTVEHGQSVGTIQLPNGYRIKTVKNGEADYDMTAAVTSDLTLTVTLEEIKHKVTFQDADGNKLGEAEVLDGGIALMPTPAEGVFWTATAEEYAKLFGVSADVTVTLGTTDATVYKNNQDWLTWAGGVEAVTNHLGANFEHWTKNGNGTYNCPQDDGNYFTMTGDFARLKFNIFAGARDSGYYDIYIDDVLVRKLEFDNSNGTGNKQEWVIALEKTMIPAGQHTIKIVAHTKTQITAIEAWYAVRKDNYDVSFKNGDAELSKETVPAGTTVAKPATDPTPGDNQEFLFWSLDGETEYDFTKPVNSDLTLKAIFKYILTYVVTFQTEDGTEITKVTVGKGLNAAYPKLPDNEYWTATAEEYAKMFNVTQDRTITFGRTARSNYKNLGAGTFSIGNETNINTVKSWGFDFTNWKIQDDAGTYGVYEQESGAKITITANLCKVAFATQVEAGKTCTYKVYIDGQLHITTTIDNSTGDSVNKNNGYNVVCDPANFPAGQHTVVIEIEGAGTIHAATIVQYVAPTA